MTEQLVLDLTVKDLCVKRVALKEMPFRFSWKGKILTIKIPSASMRKSLEEATSHYQRQRSGSVADHYLTNRAITSETQESFRLGYVGDPLPGHEMMHGRLVIPYLTQTGVVQLRFRAIPDDGIPGNPEDSPKYKSEHESQATLYNVISLIRPDRSLIVCEGEIDCITASMAGYVSIGVPGANAWKPFFYRALRYRQVFVLADNDDKGAGIKFAETVKNSLYGAKIILMPEGHDVNSFVVAYGIDKLREKIGL